MMSRKHYNAIAAALRSGKASENLVWMIADRLKDDNIRFNLGKFLAKAQDGPTMEQRAAKYLREQMRAKLLSRARSLASYQLKRQLKEDPHL